MSEGMFPGHPKTGPWQSLKGAMLSPHIAGPLEGHNSGEARFNGEVGIDGWEKSLKGHEGTTGPGGTLAK